MKLCEKRKQTGTASASTSTQNDRTIDHVDELDEYLDRLAIDIENRGKEVNAAAAATSNGQLPHTTIMSAQQQAHTGRDNSNHSANHCQQSDQSNHQISAVNGTISRNDVAHSLGDVEKTTLPLLLFGFMAILTFINSVCCKRRPTEELRLAENVRQCH